MTFTPETTVATPDEVWYEVHEGMINPREPKETGWRHWSGHASLKAARAAQKPWLWRIVRCELVDEAKP